VSRAVCAEGVTTRGGARRYGCCVGVEQAPTALPGEDMVRQGLRDLEHEVESVESLLVSIGAPRLRRLGLAVAAPLSTPEQRLYRLLERTHGDAAHSRYNALVRRLVSYERAAAAAGLVADA
jgi:hypothetical protein